MGDISEIYGGEFIVGDHEPTNDFEPLPAGLYMVEIDNAEVKTTKAGTGRYLKLEMSIIGQDYMGRKIFANINLKNPNKQAEEIGLRDLAALGLAIGVTTIKDTTDLLGKPLIVKLSVKPGDGNYGPNNEVRAYKSIKGTTAPTQPRQSQPATPAAPAGNKPPWMR